MQKRYFYTHWSRKFITMMLGTLLGTNLVSADTEGLYTFTPSDIQFLRSFSLSALPALPQDPSNAYADNLDAAKLGKALFFDKRLSRKKKFSCASCHKPEKYFTDGLALGLAFGTSPRSTPSLFSSAWSPWQYWDGRKDSLWSQALEPIEKPAELAIDRASYVRQLLRYYPDQYQAVFGKVDSLSTIKRYAKNASPIGHDKQKKRWKKLGQSKQDTINRIFTNAGKALMAYQRQLTLPPARFDNFVDALVKDLPTQAYLKPEEVKGLRLFMGKANCASCHNGPFFTNFEFHNIGAPEPNENKVDLGRYSGVKALLSDEFTCLSKWSDASIDNCEEMNFVKRTGPELVGAFKTPTLRNIEKTAPYMQAGQLPNLQAVLGHYNTPTPPFYDRQQHPNRPHFDILPLKLSDEEIDMIIQFLSSLTSTIPENEAWLNNTK